MLVKEGGQGQETPAGIFPGPEFNLVRAAGVPAVQAATDLCLPDIPVRRTRVVAPLLEELRLL